MIKHAGPRIRAVRINACRHVGLRAKAELYSIAEAGPARRPGRDPPFRNLNLPWHAWLLLYKLVAVRIDSICVVNNRLKEDPLKRDGCRPSQGRLQSFRWT